VAELCLIVHPSKFEAGDILCAFNNERIKIVHAQNICHVSKSGFNSDGLRYADSLPELFQKKVYRYKFQRVSTLEVKRIDLITLEEDIISNQANGKGEYMDVPLFIERRIKHPRHRIFGTKGSEYWYGKHNSYAFYKDIWKWIEEKTGLKEIDHTKWPATDRELKKYLHLTVDDFNNETSGDLVKPLEDTTSGEIAVMKPRKHFVEWEKLNGISLDVIKDIKDISKAIDLRDDFSFSLNVINQEKSIGNSN